MSRRISKKHLAITMQSLSLALVLICMTGCAPRYAVVDGTETVQVKKSVLDDLYKDNTALLNALSACRGGKK
jgi:hypothetical protein